MEIFRKRTRDGRTAIVTAHRDGDRTYTIATLNGEEIGRHCGPHHLPNPGAPAECAANIGRLGLTRTEADAVKTAWDAWLATHTDLMLRRERARLDVALGLALDVEAANRAHTWEQWDRGYQVPAGTIDPADQARIDAARAALDAFDQQHPEIAAEIKTKHDRDVERWATL